MRRSIAALGLAIAGLWVIIWLAATVIDRLIVIPYEIPEDAGIGSAAVTGISGIQNGVRFAALVTVLAVVIRLAWRPLRAWLRPALATGWSSWLLVFLLLAPALVMAGQPVAHVLMVGAALVLGGALAGRVAGTPRRAFLIACALLCGLGLSIIALKLGVLGEAPRLRYRVLFLPVGPLTALAITGYLVRRARSQEGGDEIPVAAGVPLLVLAVGTFADWPVAPAAAWLLVLGVGGFIWYRAPSGQNRRRGRAMAMVALAIAVTGLASPVASDFYREIDPHHEAENLLPARRVLDGDRPGEDFVTSHSLATDVVPGIVGFKLWGRSIHAPRMFRAWTGGPSRALLTWLILVQLVQVPRAVAIMVVAMGMGWVGMPYTNEVMRIQPLLLTALFAVTGAKHRDARWLYAAAACAGLAPIAVAETGLAAVAGVGVMLVAGAIFSTDRRWRSAHLRGLLVLAAGIGMTICWYLCTPGAMHQQAVRSVAAREIIVHWPDPSILNPHMVAHALVLLGASAALLVMLRRRPVEVLPGFMLTVAAGVMSLRLILDHPLTLDRVLLVDFLVVAAAVWALCGVQRSLPVAVALVLAVLMVGPERLVSSALKTAVPLAVPAGTAWSDHPRIQHRLPQRNVEVWWEMEAWYRDVGDYINITASPVDYFILDKPCDYPFIPLHFAWRPADQADIARRLQENPPPALITISQEDLRFWGVIPYSIMLHALHARALAGYEYERRIGPYHICRRTDRDQPRTWNSLIGPDIRHPLRYGMIPWNLGKAGGRGMQRVLARTAYLGDLLWYVSARIDGRGEAALTIRPRRTNAPSVEVGFDLVEGEHGYAVPLWNLCHWTGDSPGEDFEISVAGPDCRVTELRLLQGGSD